MDVVLKFISEIFNLGYSEISGKKYPQDLPSKSLIKGKTATVMMTGSAG